MNINEKALWLIITYPQARVVSRVIFYCHIIDTYLFYMNPTYTVLRILTILSRGWNERSPGRQMRPNFSSGNQVFSARRPHGDWAKNKKNWWSNSKGTGRARDVSSSLICIILNHTFINKFWSHRRHLGTPNSSFPLSSLDVVRVQYYTDQCSRSRTQVLFICAI